MKVVRIVLLAGLLFLPASLSFGQSDLPRGLYGLSCGGLFPAGGFNDHVSQNGFGLDFYYGRRIGQAPLFVGLEISVSFYGHVRRQEYLEGIPEVGVDVDTYNNIGQGLLFIRLQPRRGTVVTFIEGLAGISDLFTETTISGRGYESEEISSETNLEDFTVTAGAGAGLSVRLDKSRGRDPDRARRGGFLEFKVRYMAGGRADYLKKGSIVVEGNQFTFTPERSATSFVTAQVAFSWFF
jgi:hypothetical protein